MFENVTGRIINLTSRFMRDKDTKLSKYHITCSLCSIISTINFNQIEISN